MSDPHLSNDANSETSPWSLVFTFLIGAVLCSGFAIFALDEESTGEEGQFAGKEGDLGNVWPRRRLSSFFSCSSHVSPTVVAHPRLDGGWTAAFTMSFGAWRFKYNAGRTLMRLAWYSDVRSESPHDELMTPRDGDFVATRRHCFLRIGIHLVTGRVLSRRRMRVAEVIIGSNVFRIDNSLSRISRCQVMNDGMIYPVILTYAALL